MACSAVYKVRAEERYCCALLQEVLGQLHPEGIDYHSTFTIAGIFDAIVSALTLLLGLFETPVLRYKVATLLHIFISEVIVINFAFILLNIVTIIIFKHLHFFTGRLSPSSTSLLLCLHI